MDEIKPRKRETVTYGTTERIETGCGHLYVTINEDCEGLCELFAVMGKSGGCAASQLEAIARMVSALLRAKVEPQVIVQHLKGIRCKEPSGQALSCADAIGKALENRIKSTEDNK